MTSDIKCKHYGVNEDNFILIDGFLFCKYYGKTHTVFYNEKVTPKQDMREVPLSLQRKFGVQPHGITNLKLACQQKNYHLKMGRPIKKFGTSCERSLTERRINNIFNRLPLQNPSEHVTGPLDIDKGRFVSRTKVSSQTLTYFPNPYLLTKRQSKTLKRSQES